jgi:hypothetical protein
VAWWIKVAGTGAEPFDEDDWRPGRERFARKHGPGSYFPRRPSIRRRDRLVVYAAGSAARFGDGRLFAIEEVLSDEPEPSGHPRWPWRLATREVVAVPLLRLAPSLREIGVIPRSLSQHSHIRLRDEQGERVEALMRRYAGEALTPRPPRTPLARGRPRVPRR